MHKKLPHIDAINHYQFVTFRTNDSMDLYIKNIIHNSSIKQNIKQYKIDKLLDNSTNGAYLNDDVLNFLSDFLKKLNKNIYELVCFVIMPNNLHILFKQLKSMDNIMRVIKSKSAIEINKLLNKSGKFWANDYYDKVIRDDKHFEKVYNYIKNNAPKAGLDESERFYSVYEM